MLQGLVFLFLLVQLILGSAESYDAVAIAPMFSLEWRFDDFAKDILVRRLGSNAGKVFEAWDGTVHFSLSRVAFETNLTQSPRLCLTHPEMCRESESDGSLSRFVLPLDDFTQVLQDDIDTAASRLLDPATLRAAYKGLGLAPTDAPWHFDLAVTSGDNGTLHACGGIEEYEYSYGSPSGTFGCNRVWDVRLAARSLCPPILSTPPRPPPCARQPDGSVHGNPRSYGPYDGMNASPSP